jgi:hypothetical protein
MIFLKSNPWLEDLFEFIGCQFLTEVEVYLKFIFLQFEINLLTPEGRNVHMKYVRDILFPKLQL